MNGHSPQSTSLFDLSMIESAKQKVEEAIQFDTDNLPIHYYNLACLYRSMVGDGILARKNYELAVGAAKARRLSGENDRSIVAYSSENMMLLALSYEEYEKWVEELTEVDSENPILAKDVPIVRDKGDQFLEWHQVMSWRASSFYSADPADPNNPGMYAEAASTYHLVLSNLEELEVDPDHESKYALAYAPLVMMTLTRHAGNMATKLGDTKDNQLYLIMNAVIPVLNKYMAKNPADDKVEKFLTMFKERRYGTWKPVGSEDPHKVGDYPPIDDLHHLDPIRHFLKALELTGEIPLGNVSLNPAESIVSMTPISPPTPKLINAFTMPNCHLVFDLHNYPNDFQSLRDMELLLRAYINSIIGTASNTDGLICSMGENPLSQLKINGQGIPIPPWGVDEWMNIWVIGSDIIGTDRIWLTIGLPTLDQDTLVGGHKRQDYYRVMQSLLNGFNDSLCKPFSNQRFPLPQGMGITRPGGGGEPKGHQALCSRCKHKFIPGENDYVRGPDGEKLSLGSGAAIQIVLGLICVAIAYFGKIDWVYWVAGLFGLFGTIQLFMPSSLYQVICPKCGTQSPYVA